MGHSLSIASRDGRDPRSLALRDVTEAAFAPGEATIVALSQGAVHGVDVASGAVVARSEAAEKGIHFASATRVAVGTRVLRVPDLSYVYSIGNDAELRPKVVASLEIRGSPKGQRTIAVVRRESGSWRWALFMLGYMTALAYVASLAVYQVGRLLGIGTA